MIGYNDIKRIKEETKVLILTAPDGHDRLLFYRDPFSSKHTCLIRRQIPINGKWRNTEGLLSDQLALQLGGVVTTKDRGNHRYLEFVDKGYVKSTATLEEV